jgi:DNA-binding IclR family transcriptional regulator
MILSPLRHRPLTLRILRYLEALQEPCPFLMVAEVLRQPAAKVQLACQRLTKQGRLARVKQGHYTITARGAEASRGGPL